MDKAIVLHSKWRKAWITNDFVFNNVMQIGTNCRDLLRAILPELNIQKVTTLTTQKQIDDQQFSHGVRLDVYAEDDHQRIYDIEMQAERRAAIGQRLRYYQSKLEKDSLPKGLDYGRIKDTYIIFLMPFDFFGAGLKQYYLDAWQVRSLDIPLHTGALAMILNSRGTKCSVTPELQSFFSLMNGNYDVNNDFGKRILADIETVKRSPAKEREFMDLSLVEFDARWSGEQKGLKEGAKKERMKIARHMANKLRAKQYSNEQIKENLNEFFENLSDKEVNKIINSLN